jgi:MoxR-like ATPase
MVSLGPETSKTVDEMVAACQSFGDRDIILLSGVAGTGKTFLGLVAAVRFAGHPLLVKQIQFHQSYAYEDFMEGLRPTAAGGFAPRAGILMEWNETALQDPDNRYVLLIEEFTRANITAVLGELMTYIEHRDRLFETPLTRRRVRIAKNLTILATMNPQDRSALEVDDALIRRLRIIDCPPSVAHLEEMLKSSLPSGGANESGKKIITDLKNLFEQLQKQYPDTFAELMPFGHGVFAGIKSEDDLRSLWRQRLRFLLRRNPQVPPHPWAHQIEQLYPWRNSSTTVS